MKAISKKWKKLFITLTIIVGLLFVSLFVNNRIQEPIRATYNEELQAYFSKGRIVANILGSNWGVSIFKYLVDKRDYRIPDNLDVLEVLIQSRSDSNYKIRAVIYSPKNQSGELPAMLYAHGGGYETGAPEQFIGVINNFISKRPIVVIAPAYRLSQKHPFPAGFNDCYDVLLWMKENGLNYGFSTEKFVIAGHSAGGGMTAALTLKARDTEEVNVAFQLPIYPMIDHRQNTESVLASKYAPIWDKRSNKVAWNNYLKELKESNREIPTYASPSLNDNFENLPPTISFVGSLEPFKDETINYMNSLEHANVEVRFKLFEGAFHAFELIAPEAQISKEADEFLMSSFGEFYDLFL